MHRIVITRALAFRAVLFFTAITFRYSLSFAGGFQVGLQGEKQTGMGHCGTGLVLDNSVIFFNPGGLAMLGTNGIHAGGSAIMARLRYAEQAPGQYQAANSFGVSPPFNLYGNWGLGQEKKFQMGLGVYTPFGSHVAYPADWKGQFMLRELSLRTIFIQPTFSYRLTDWLGIGVGVVMATGTVDLKKGIPVQFSDGSYGEASLSGAGSGYGFNAGIYFRPAGKFSAGLNYRSAVRFQADGGTATFSVPDNLSEYFPTTTFSSTLRLPSNLTLGLGYACSEKLKLALDIQYVGWSVYDTLAFDFKDETDKLTDQHSPREYRNAFVFRTGVQYRIHDNLDLRGGAYFDMTPVRDGYLTPETPDANKIGLTAGLSWRMHERFSLDASFLYVEGFRRESGNTENNFHGIFKARAFIPGIGLNVLFPTKTQD